MECKSDCSNTREDTKYRDVIERHISSPLVMNVLTGESSFKGEVERFYDSGTYWVYTSFGKNLGGMSEQKHRFERFDNIKIGTYPKDLVAILDDFSEEGFDVQRLRYDVLREDFRRIEEEGRKRMKRGLAVTFGTCLAGFSFLFLGENVVENDTIRAAITAGVSLPASFYSLFRALIPSEGNGAFKEYEKLYRAAEKADLFIVEGNCRGNLIKQLLNKNSSSE